MYLFFLLQFSLLGKNTNLSDSISNSTFGKKYQVDPYDIVWQYDAGAPVFGSLVLVCDVGNGKPPPTLSVTVMFSGSILPEINVIK